ncbi:VOC family protein [Thalassospira australica]|uniref:2-oxoadipate dioxygenase/decarboxylase HglS n=1 Tax=Thalassospira australica TaxID=1528106 RepID=UPI000519F3CA|nr:VOC family protein [Thalassospira australica]
MSADAFVHPDEIRSMFSGAMSEMYRAEVPQYGTLMELVSEVNQHKLTADSALAESLADRGEMERIDLERHGAIRLGKPEELFNIRRLFAVMGMHPVGYYDLSVAGVPVHSTAFRPIDDAALKRNPFRVFTSLLRLELIEDKELRDQAEQILAQREIFTANAIKLISVAEDNGGLTRDQAAQFVAEALETFRWHSSATVSLETYNKLHDAHRLIADVVCFKGPHINHLTPRTLDIDAVQREMPKRGISPKAVVEGPPTRNCPILLRQTSFKALEERVEFAGDHSGETVGTHTARFGEIEQRGIALTSEGRKLYDTLLSSVRHAVQINADGSNACDYDTELTERFKAFPDDYETLRVEKLAFFRYRVTDAGLAAAQKGGLSTSVDELVDQGYLRAEPIIYEDFLPVSAAGIFQSNLGSDGQKNYSEHANQDVFEKCLGAKVANELSLYAELEAASLEASYQALGIRKQVA